MSVGRKNINNKTDWNTPPKYIIPIRDFYNGEIDLDPCSNIFSLVNAKINFMYSDKDGLKEEWIGNKIFVNPPYGRNNGTSLYDWFKKSIQEYKTGKEIIFLVPVATNTKHFKEIIFKHFSAICFLSDTRLKFYSEGKENKKGAPMACCLCYLGHRKEKFKSLFNEFGKVFFIEN